MTIASKLQTTLDTKQAIKQSLISKGLEPTDEFGTYPGLIDELGAGGIATPQIIAPISGAIDVAQSPIITGSRFVGLDADGVAEMHVASTWEFATDAGFTNILHSSGRNTASLERYDLDAAGVKFEGATVYVRVTYEGASGELVTSLPVSFTTIYLAVGVTIAGDIVVSQRDGYWLLAAGAGRRVKRKWGLHNIDTTLPNDPSPDPNDGVYNTDVLTGLAYNSISDGQGNVGSPAADYCRSLGADFFLPNQEELNEIFLNKDVIDAADTSGGANTLASFGTDYVWSSTEWSSVYAQSQRFSDGDQTLRAKNISQWVIPLRRIAV